MRSLFIRVCLQGAGLAILICATAGPAFAGGPTPPVPEIDGGSIATGLAGLSAAVLIVRSRRRAK
jgi:hypothetical protein